MGTGEGDGQPNSKLQMPALCFLLYVDSGTYVDSVPEEAVVGLGWIVLLVIMVSGFAV